MLLLWAPLAGVAGEEIASREVGAAAVPGARSSPPSQLPRPPWGAGAGVGCSFWGTGKAPRRRFLFLLCSPGLLSGALLSALGTWLRPLRPSVASCRPHPGLGSTLQPACQEVPRVPRLWAARSWGHGMGMWGEALVKFSEPLASFGVRLGGSGRVCLGGTLLLLSDSGQP